MCGIGWLWAVWQWITQHGAAEWWAAIGEFLIVAVIYYEVEETRFDNFLKSLENKDFYDQRALLYEAYTEILPGNENIKERAEAFAEKLWKDADLRKKLDSQWSNLIRLQYGTRRSIFNRKPIAKWFPQVMISIWAMSAVYLRKREERRGTALNDKYGYKAIKQSLRIMKKKGFKGKKGFYDIEIYSKDGSNDVKIPASILKRMLDDDLDAPFKS